MSPLPPGHTLCRPTTPGPRCRNCKRWVDHPEQVIGHVVRIVNTSNQRDPACVHVPVSRLQEAK
jgi:hypothetical protein